MCHKTKEFVMKKTIKSIVLVLILVLFTSTITGCIAVGTGLVLGGITGLGELAADGVVDGIGKGVEKGRYKKAAKTVIQYDEEDTF
jgi:hypothetical protein